MTSTNVDKFICVSYCNIDFLIPDGDVCSAFCSLSYSSAIADGGIPFEGNEIRAVDFDKIVSLFNIVDFRKEIKTSLVVKNSGLFPPECGTRFSILTSSDCRVCRISLSKFSPFSDFYAKRLSACGIEACFFEDGKISYLLNINKFCCAAKNPRTGAAS